MHSGHKISSSPSSAPAAAAELPVGSPHSLALTGATAAREARLPLLWCWCRIAKEWESRASHERVIAGWFRSAVRCVAPQVTCNYGVAHTKACCKDRVTEDGSFLYSLRSPPSSVTSDNLRSTLCLQAP
eukprot:TRINITY_DN5552_c0_g2_i1.p1 TRINITY_DN5552_c0_g2~~TRINITY_DN5552_c0_g2_i1.p1  ORF type:complete len:129 (-),score=5.30 TRINITY_DN5552_c0_g2_i1:58-444(-)